MTTLELTMDLNTLFLSLCHSNKSPLFKWKMKRRLCCENAFCFAYLLFCVCSFVFACFSVLSTRTIKPIQLQYTMIVIIIIIIIRYSCCWIFFFFFCCSSINGFMDGKPSSFLFCPLSLSFWHSISIENRCS